MENWLAIAIVLIILAILIGNFSTFQENTKHKMRPKGLNDLKETLPRTKKE